MLLSGHTNDKLSRNYYLECRHRLSLINLHFAFNDLNVKLRSHNVFNYNLTSRIMKPLNVKKKKKTNNPYVD